MNLKIYRLTAVLTLLLLPGLAVGGGKKRTDGVNDGAEIAGSNAVLWIDPGNIASRDLYYGPGGKEHQPHGPFTFEKEDMDGSNPKFMVRDSDGVKWKVKMGVEARPETVASRLVWAVGYPTNEDYFVGELHVQGMPARLRRGQNLVQPGGTVMNVRLKRHEKGEEKVEPWRWRGEPFARTREFNGLRVMMALINNWDLKDENNAIYKDKDGKRIYIVSDLGASFGTTALTMPHSKAKGNLKSYEHSKFIDRIGPEFVDFHDPGTPALEYWFNIVEFVNRERLLWIGKKIPRSDAEWVGQLLSQLTREQIENAFRAAGYSPEEVTGFRSVVETRIAKLKTL
jgi:hypothetical protein